MTLKTFGVLVVGSAVLATTVIVAHAQGPIRIGASMSLTGTYASSAGTSMKATSSAGAI